MNDVSVSVSVPKELNALGNAIVAIVADLKAGQSLAVVAASSLPALLEAVSAYAELKAEIADHAIYMEAGLLVGQLLQALIPAPAAAPAV